MNKVTCIKSKDYTTISNSFFRDKELSLKAKGLLAMALTLPDDWDFSIKGLEKIIKEGKASIYSAIDELKERGYCRVETLRNDKGMMVGNDYTFCESPHQENPYTENPDMDNQTQTTIDNNTNEQNKENKEKELKEKQNKLFEECWVAYRRKGVKAKAKTYWNKLKESEKNMVLRHVNAYIATRDIQFQQAFERYLRDKTFLSVVFKNNSVIYDPQIYDNSTYTPNGRTIWYDENTKAYWTTDPFYDGFISDGYDDENRPDGAKLILNNARGSITWSREQRKWKRNEQDFGQR